MALGLDEYTLLTKMQAAKDSIVPSIDDCSLTEIENFVAELHHEHNLNKEEIIGSLANQNENGGSGDVSDNKSSLALFDKLQTKEDQELDDSVSSVRSSNSFRSMSTRK